MRVIDVDAIVVHKFPSEDYDPSENDAEKAYRKGWNDALDAVAEFQPSAQPEDKCGECDAWNKYKNYPSVKPKKGKWIPHYDEVVLFDGMSIGGMACSVCGWKTHNKMHLFFGCPYKYCPNCGARMSGGEEDE